MRLSIPIEDKVIALYSEVDLHSLSKGAKVVTAHQPGFWHPGIWIKTLLLNRISRNGRLILLDFDITSKEKVTIPQIIQQRVSLYSFNPFNKKIWYNNRVNADEFVAMVQERIRGFDIISHNFEKNKLHVPKTDDAIDFYNLWRANLEGGVNYKTVRYSSLLKTDEYAEFINVIRQRGDALFEIYNEELVKYRKKYKIRGENPFKLMEVRGAKKELPLWFIEQDERYPVFWENKKFYYEKGEIKNYEKIYPRGPLITLFIRAFVADIFIHGVSGFNYDEITENIANQFWGIKLCPKVGISATVFLNFDNYPDFFKIEKAIRKIEEEKKNYVKMPVDGMKELIEQRDSIIKRINDAEDKKSLYKKLKIIKRQIEDKARPYIEKLDREKEKLMEILATKQVYCFREYPYFLYTYEQLAEIFDRSLHGTI